MLRRSKKVIGLVLAGTLLLAVGCGKNTVKEDSSKNSIVKNETKQESNNAKEGPFSRERSIMALGTFINLKASDGSEEDVSKALDASVERIKDIENLVSVNIDTSEIAEINKKGFGEFKVSEDTFKLVEKSLKYGELTQGAFDITVYPAVKLWGIGTENADVPQESKLKEILDKIDYKKVSVKEESIVRVEKDTGIDLGAIAKGYIADEVKGIFKEHNITSGFLNFGGNILAIGEKTNGSPWKIGVRNPFSNNGDYFGIISVKDKTIVTSGNYERFFEKDGVRYHHILDPEDGYPAETGLASTTIVADISVDADALSTSVFILGKEKGIELLESLPGVEGVFVTKDKKVYTTSGLQETFRITDSDFKKEALPPKDKEEGEKNEEKPQAEKEVKEEAVEIEKEEVKAETEVKPKAKTKETPKVEIIENPDGETQPTYD